jgi:transcriptional regulator with XRE-family HTH domain
MLALPSSCEAGKRLRAKRERLHLSIRRVEQLSQKIAAEKNDPAFYVPHNWISDLENGKSKPRLAKFHSLSLIYDCDINEILTLFGLNVMDLGNERGVVTLPHTHLSGLPLVRSAAVTDPPNVAGSPPLKRTTSHCRIFQGLGDMAMFLAQQARPEQLLYGYVGTDDYTLDPIIRPARSCKSIHVKTRSFEESGRANTNVRSILSNCVTTASRAVGAKSREAICCSYPLPNRRCQFGIFDTRKMPRSWVASLALPTA